MKSSPAAVQLNWKSARRMGLSGALRVQPNQFRVRITVRDRNDNLGPQMLAIDGLNYKSYRLVPIGGDVANKKANFPQGEYVSPDINGDLDELDKSRWFFVAADHQCSNGVVFNFLSPLKMRMDRQS